jgi:hypothetical protein
MPVRARKPAAEVFPRGAANARQATFPATAKRRHGCSVRRKSASTTVGINAPQEISEFPADSLQTAAERPAAEALYAVKFAGGGFPPPLALNVESCRQKNVDKCRIIGYNDIA